MTLAAAVSLGLAAAAWLAPRHVPLLAPVAVVMLAFAVLDVGEAAHQLDVDASGLAALAAVLHAAAAALAALVAFDGGPAFRQRGVGRTLPLAVAGLFADSG